ncbi:NMCC_0638 family (lipo)protein [Niveispirillum lacus]|nr:hypothetical protein [Niveispirillum lacus]
MRKVILTAMLALVPLMAFADEKTGDDRVGFSFDMKGAPSQDKQEIARSVEVFDVFMESCLSWKFKRKAAFIEKIKANGYSEMSKEAVKAVLKGKEGIGWVNGDPTSSERIEVIYQEAPSRTCSIFAYNGNTENHEYAAQQMLTALDASLPGISFKQLPPKQVEGGTRRIRGYVLGFVEEGKEAEASWDSLVMFVVDPAPDAPFRVLYTRMEQ